MSDSVVYDWDYEAFTVDEFLENLELYEAVNTPPNSQPSSPTSITDPKVYDVKMTSTPKRKTFGAQMNDMRIEIAKLREEIAYRDAQLLDMYYLLYNKVNKT